jgi:hypothetical protein
MISLEQIRLLESKVTRTVELLRVLKEENATLRRGLDSAQRRMKELETLVEGFKVDQKEIESAILRTLRNLDDLEEAAAHPAAPGPSGGRRADPAPAHPPASGPAPGASAVGPSPKEELDIF